MMMNPPYSAKWSAAAGFLQDERFSEFGVLAPRSKADYAFLLHGLYYLKSNDRMAIAGICVHNGCKRIVAVFSKYGWIQIKKGCGMKGFFA